MTGDTLEVLKTEIEEDLGKNITEQEERITINSDLISTVTDEVAKNEVDVRSFERRLNEQKKETIDLINGVFSNLSGVLAGAVQNVGVGDVCFFLTMRCFNDAMFSNS